MDVETLVRERLERSGLGYEIVACDPDLADTAVFCERYGYAMEQSANAIVVRTKSGPLRYAMCLVLATTRLDVNRTVRRKLEARKVSFAGAGEAEALTGMPQGGITPLALPEGLALWIDKRVMALDRVILGGASRASKIIVSPAIFRDDPAAEVVEGLALERA